MIKSVELSWRFGTIELPAADQYIREAIEVTGEYCGTELELYQSLLDPGDVAVDIGANIGVFSIGMALAVGSTGRVLAFEPQPAVFAMLERNLARHRLTQVEPARAIVSDHDGEGEFVDVRGVPEGRRLNFGGVSTTTRIAAGYGSMVPTPICCLDTLEFERCALVKVDVEGGEEAVLAGATVTLARCRPVLSLECDRPNSAVPWADSLLAANYRLWRFRGPLVRSHNPKRATVEGILPFVSIMVLAVPEERVHLLDRVDRSSLQSIDSRATLEQLSRQIVQPSTRDRPSV